MPGKAGVAGAISRFFPAIVAVLALTVIAPAIWSGWIGDDAFYSVLDGVLGADRITLVQAMRHSFDVWLHGNGRFYPGLVVEKYVVFAIFTNLIAYKTLLVAATLATVELFRRCVTAYVTQGYANLAALIAVALLTERGYHDSILSYNAMPQFVALCVLGSLLAFRRVLDGRGSLALAVLLYAVAALTYEDAYGFCLLYPALAKPGRSWLQVARSSAPFLAIGAGLTALSLVLRAVAHLPPGSMYATSFGSGALLRTFGDQVVAALPLSYWLFDPSHIFSRANPYDFFNNAPVRPSVFIIFAAAAAYALAAVKGERISGWRPAAIGAFVTALAAAPIAPLVKYQHELQLGLGYLPVFYETFGVALAIAALAVWTLRTKTSRAVAFAWIAAIAAAGTMTQAANVRLVRENQPSRTARAALERQLDGGLLAGAADGVVVAIPSGFDWIVYDDAGPDGISTRGMFFLHGKKRVRLTSPGDPRAALALSYDRRRLAWRLVSAAPRSRRTPVRP